jgi:hypothetical protein
LTRYLVAVAVAPVHLYFGSIHPEKKKALLNVVGVIKKQISKMSPSATEILPVMEKLSKANIGVYTNPGHELWVGEAQPSLESVEKGDTLKVGEVTVGIKSTGICGWVPLHQCRTLLMLSVPTCISGTLAALAL